LGGASSSNRAALLMPLQQSSSATKRSEDTVLLELEAMIRWFPLDRALCASCFREIELGMVVCDG
jgi:hypothetical protein